MFDQRRVSQERVIGISFVDILIQAVFVLLVALFVGYVDPSVQIVLEEKSEYAQIGKDLCNKVNKDSIEACREYLNDKQTDVEPKKKNYGEVGEHICRSFKADSPEECRSVTDRELARIRPCLKPISEYSIPPTLTLILKNPTEIEFIGFSTNYIQTLEEKGDKVRLARVLELDRLKGRSLTPQQVHSDFDFIRENNCYHAVHTRRPGAFSDNDLRESLDVAGRLRRPNQ